MVIGWCQLGTVGRMWKSFPPKWFFSEVCGLRSINVGPKGTNLSITQALNHFLHCTMSYCKFCIDVIRSDTPVSSNEDSLMATATRLIFNTRVPIFEMFRPFSNTAVAHAVTSIGTLMSGMNCSSRFSNFNKEFNHSTLSKRNIALRHFGYRFCGHVIAENNVTI